MKKIKKLLAVSLICSFLIVLAACSKSKKDDTKSDNGLSKSFAVNETGLSDSDVSDIYNTLQQRTDKVSQQYEISHDTASDGREVFTITLYDTDESAFDTITAQGKLEFIENYGVSGENVVITNDDIKNAVASSSRIDGIERNKVDITFTDEGSAKFATATKNNIGKNIAIVYDGKLISNPTVAAEISGGTVELTNLESFEEAKKIENTITSGFLRYTLTEISQ